MKPEDNMNIILVGKSHGKSRVLALNGTVAFALALAVAALIAAAGWGGYSVAVSQAEADKPSDSELVAEWQSKLGEQKAELAGLQQNVQDQVDALTLRLGEIQGRLLRLDALGQRFVESGLVGSDEFDFNQPAAVGGPEDSLPADSFSAPELTRMIDELEHKMQDREQQLRLLDQVSSRQKLEDELYLEGRPITWGWLSSRYGYRSDPFTGKRTWHAGVDLAGKDGSDIISVAGGVVSYAGERYGYGNLVEIDHGDGLITRYAHCKTIKVNVGDVIQKGQVLALMGSTGRSTGPHVHFEVMRNGKSENPETYIKRASR
ncbi:MAG: M23 family metallopeptidase [Marinobacter sp.]|uniref:M23 family metallopeptidase n=1 Tax=Marinobacter sp. TaxID=50741 RepID=UPI001B6F98CF|nr:M23 family metallopeptidase [Marinobacter sp.]MBQ0745454.1 M23 family metallopeptidase [Marinobacter sp.]MBQ0813142.1 M23 family metallopeptidase [Marinobacter sp.]|tara:strand:+ start:3957 stop:4910 length:954 start_codon:yes stop_codon:yes gene_type:complete